MDILAMSFHLGATYLTRSPVQLFCYTFLLVVVHGVKHFTQVTVYHILKQKQATFKPIFSDLLNFLFGHSV